jgi:hypothetical protein
MSYDNLEKSDFAGKPVEFIKFALGADKVFRYTNQDEIINHLGEDYTPATFERSSPAQSPEIEQNKLKITFQPDSPIIQLFKKTPPLRPVFAILYRKHEGDADVLAYWQGRVEGVSFGEVESEITLGSMESTLRRKGLRMCFSPTCRAYLYDGIVCPVPMEPFQTECVITGETGSIISAGEFGAFPDDWFPLGFVEAANGDCRLILEQNADELTLIAPFEDSVLGSVVKAYAGCDLSSEMCESKFGEYTDEGRAWGGFGLVPIKNPFESGVS